MTRSLRGALCATLFGMTALVPLAASADPLFITVPIGQFGPPTALSTWQAEQMIRKIPGGADVVDAKEYKEGAAQTIKDMLVTTPGVFVQPKWGDDSRLSIRGSGLSRSFHLRGITLMQDGIPYNFSDGNGDFQEFDPLAIQHVEIYRGGQALRYGSATLGGAINMVTPTARTAGHNALFRAEMGSFNTYRAHAQAAQTFDGFDVFAAATKSINDGYRPQSEQNNTRFNANVGIPLGRNAETRFYLTWNDIEQDLPNSLTKDDALNHPKRVAAINVLNDYGRDMRSLRLANKTAFELSNGLKAEIGGYMNDKTLYHPIFQVLDQDSRDLGLFGRLSGSNTLNGLPNEFMLGLNASRGVNNADRFVNVQGERGAKTADGRQEASNVELYGENRLEVVPDWTLITGLHGNFSSRDYEDHLNPANDADTNFRSLNPRLGVMWQATPQTEVFASVTRSTEMPTFSELVQGAIVGFVPVEPQKAWTVEIGSRGTHNAFSWDATLYHARIKDEMLQFNVGPDIPASTFNADETIHQGIELGLGWQALPWLGFNAIYNYNDFRFDNDVQFGDNELAGAPPHQIRLSARYEDHGVYVEPNVELIPDAPFADYANTLKSDSYAVLGMKAGWEVLDNVTLFVDGRNLTDEDYISNLSTSTDARVGSTALFYPGAGRSVFGGLTVKF